MNYSVIINDQAYELPNKTISVVKDLDRLMKIDSVKGLGIEERYRELYNFEKNLLGEENVKNILGTDNFNDVDLSTVTLTFLKIKDTYEKPVADYKIEKSMSTLNSMQVDKVVNLMNVAKEVPVSK